MNTGDEASEASQNHNAATGPPLFYDAPEQYADQLLHMNDDHRSRTSDANGHSSSSQLEHEARLRLLESIVANANDAVVVTEAGQLDEPGPRILYVNPAFTQLTGYSEAEVIGKPPRVLQGPGTDRATLDLVRRAIESRTPVCVELMNYTRSGRPYWVEMSISPINDELGRTTHFLAIQRDITERKLSLTLERDRRLLSELIAADGSLQHIYRGLAMLLEHQLPGSHCRIVWRGSSEAQERAALPEPLQRILSAITDLERSGEFIPGQMQLISDASADPRCQSHGAALKRLEVNFCALLPLAAGGGIAAALLVWYAKYPCLPIERATNLLIEAAQMASLALERRRLGDQLVYQAHHDALTGLPNRAYFDTQIENALARAHSDGQQLGLLFIDLDNFKHLNDTLGHPIGDALLTQVARRLRGRLPPSATLARWGGDEFLVLLPAVADRVSAIRIANALLEILLVPFEVAGHELVIGASIGLCIFPDDATDATSLLKHADSALHAAKSRGRSTVQSFTPSMTDRARRLLDLEPMLRRALARSELLIYYQPQVDLASHTVVSVEALVRWMHPERGLVMPGEFIPLAEASGMIVPVCDWVLEAACFEAAEWQRQGRPLRISVNISALQFAQEDFLDRVMRVLEASGLEPGNLELEITEGVVMQDLEHVTLCLQRLCDLGVRLALDDFGTGYSSLAYLRRLPLDVLKIDRVFVQDLDAAQVSAVRAGALVEAIISLAHSLTLQVVAEGVETPTQLAALREIGCDVIQGYLFARPLPSAQLWSVVKAIEAGGSGLL